MTFPKPRMARAAPGQGLPADALMDAVDVVAEGRRIASEGISYLVDGILPAYGMIGFLVAFTRVGKSTLSRYIGACVAGGRVCLDRPTRQRRVLVVAAEDPSSYTAYESRHLIVERGAMTFYCAPIVLDKSGLEQLRWTVRTGGYGLVLISSWQAVIQGLLRDENDNAAAVQIVERTKAVVRDTGVPWLVDAHAGKSESQEDEADPSRSLRGASGAAGAADFILSLRYDKSPFGSRRRLTGKGRFVSLPQLLIDYDTITGLYTVVGENGGQVHRDTTWRLICETGALTTEWQTVPAIARAAGLVTPQDKPSREKTATSQGRRQVIAALHSRDGVEFKGVKRGKRTWMYYRSATTDGAGPPT
jgi:AAA domain